jgi:hypothetical protein
VQYINPEDVRGMHDSARDVGDGKVDGFHDISMPEWWRF